MNRNERRVAARSGRNTPSDASGATSILARAEAHRRHGRFSEADALCIRLLAAEPLHAQALHMRGMLASQQGRPEDALTYFKQALAIAPMVAAIHDGLADAYRATAQPVDAERHYRRVAELLPGPATCLNLGNSLMELQRPADAAAVYRSALRFDARLPEAYLGLGTALVALGGKQAVEAFANAIALRPDFTAAHESLIDACLEADDRGAALRAACQALLQSDTPRLRLQFTDIVANLPLTMDLPGLRGALQRALAERWTRPQDLVRAACDLVVLRQPFDVSDALLHAVLELAPVCHRAVEQALTSQRRLMLDAAIAGKAPAGTPDALAAVCALARQCFINEYAWHCLPEEHRQVGTLREQFQADLDRGVVPSGTPLTVLAMYLPLASLDGADRLLSHQWPANIAAVLAQQVSEPAEEERLRHLIHRVTALNDDTSRLVRDQYEANPYPRWAATAGAIQRIRLADWLTEKFPGKPVAALPSDGVLDVLIAGCGTGQHAVETIRSLAEARVLAIDLSLASLAYAARMTAKLSVDDIEYVQANLLHAEQLGRRFGMIGVGGVLHHLADPWAGWRALYGTLHPGGVMNVLLYTVRGRRDVGSARGWIAAQGYAATAEGIRECRHALMALPDEWALRLSGSPDFFSISGCRDLLFHVQEQAVTLPEVARFLAAESIDLLGIEVSAATGRAFDAWDQGTSRDPQRDLARWDLFEAEHPDCFAGMLNLWVQKPRGISV